MKKILLKDGDNYIEYELNGLELTYTYSDDPRYHIVCILRSQESFEGLRRELNDICRDEGYDVACDYLQTVDCSNAYFVDNSGYAYSDIRDREAIDEYLNEATDKVWLTRNCDIENRRPEHEVGRPAMERILETYDDIPETGYDTWQCGYWNGIMAALRWVLGDDRDFLDT